MQKGKISITTSLWLFALIPMVVVGFALGGKSAEIINNKMEEACYQKLYMVAEDMTFFYENELAEHGDIEYSTDFVDSHLQDGIELTLFIDDVRFVTSIKGSDGKRNEGTTADSSIYAQVKNGNRVSEKGVKIGNEMYYVCYVPIKNPDGSFFGMAFAGAPMEEIASTIKKALLSMLVLTIPSLVVLIIVIIVFSKKIRTSMQGTVSALTVLSEGDVTSKVDVHSVINEIADMINATALLQEKLSESIGGVKETASSLDESVENVDHLSENSASGAAQIKEAVTDLAVTAQSMAETVQQANTNVIEMGDSITDIADKVQNMAADSDRMLSINDETMLFMNKVQESTAKAVESIINIGTQTKNTDEAVEKIKSAAEIIAAIADQTNLLSLNASIEAARAGEAGKGFAVVADNIKELAEQSAESANSIQQVVNEIVTLSEQSVALADETVVVIKDQEVCITDAVQKITELNEAVRVIVVNVEAIDEETQKLDEKKESVLANIDDLSAISEENAASSEEVTANVESIASGIEGTKDQSREMRNMAELLVEKIDYFH